ncbi:hypothetical protein ABPG74_011524 [Tetrahymena malaccensis]
MSVEVEALEAHLATLKIEEQSIDWKQLTDSQAETTKAFEALQRQIFSLKDNLSKNFVCILKELKDFDLKDLSTKAAEKKSSASSLKNLAQYATVDGSNITINTSQINKIIKEKQSSLIEANQRVQAKLFETAQWADSFVRLLNVTKDSAATTNDKQVAETFQLSTESTKKFDFPEDKLNDIVSKIQVTYIPDTQKYISIQTYQQIVEHSVDLAEEEFIRLTFENRKERREIMHNDKKKYLFLMQENMNDIENMLMKAQEDICAKLGITQEILEKSEMCLMERGLGQHIFMMQATVRQRIKEKLPKKKSVSADITKEIIRFQIKMLNEKQEYFLPILKQMPKTVETSQLVPILLNMMINDLVFEEYSLEDEDYMQNLNDQSAFNDREIMELLNGIEKGIYNLFAESDFIPKGMPMGMPPGGMPPMGMPYY